MCDPGKRGVSDFRVLAIKLFSRDVPFHSGEQESRIIVNQAQQRVALYLHGDVREWKPAPGYCDDQRMQLATSGRGLLRLEYETQAHVVPLNFQAYPRKWEIDQEGLEEICERFEALVWNGYRATFPRWKTIPVHSPPGPIDTSVLIPLPEGAHDGEKASFEEGTYNTREVADMVGLANSMIELSEPMLELFAKTPKIVKGAAGLAAWAVQEAVGQYAGVSVDNHVANALQAMKAINEKWAAEPGLNPNREYASKPVSFGGHDFSAVDADYTVATVLDMRENTEIEEPVDGFAQGHMSWPAGTIQLQGRGLTAGAPAALATAPVMPTGSIADALAMAKAMGAENVPDLADIESQLPKGMSLDKQPIHMHGRAGSGPTIAPNLQEWTISYFIEIDGDGEEIAKIWFDPRR